MITCYGPGEYLQQSKEERVLGILKNHKQWNGIVRRQENQENCMWKNGKLSEMQIKRMGMEAAVMQEEENTLMINMAVLPERYQSVIKGNFLCGKTHRELAQEIGVSERTVQRRLQDGVALLTELVKESFSDAVCMEGSIDIQDKIIPEP